MGKKILGISAFYHDSAAALAVDGQIIAAAQEERFSRVKQDASFPSNAVEYCLKEGGITTGELDYVVFHEKPFLKFDRILETFVSYAPLGWRSFLTHVPGWLKKKLHLPREIKKQLGGGYEKKVVFPRHHESHAASAFFPSPFEEAAVLTVDGVGEWETSTVGSGRGNRIEIHKSLHYPHSLGMLYSAFTYFAGFRVNSGEYKLMGLAPYGKPVYRALILDKLIDLKADGSFALDMSYFSFAHGMTMTNRKFEQMFERGPRKPGEAITEREMDLAASIQVVTEEILLGMAKCARELTGMPNLCMAGGVALNCVANGKLQESGIFDRIWIQPAAGDAGGALGAALFVNYQLLQEARQATGCDGMSGAMLGPEFSGKGIREFLESKDASFTHYVKEVDLLGRVAKEIREGKVVGWFQGRMEFGPRALGARSILGDARRSDMQARMNLRTKFRESFRPFAPAVLAEDAGEYFEIEGESPYMLRVARIRESIQKGLTEGDMEKMASSDLLERVKVVRSEIPAVTHVDMSARVQTVTESGNGRFYRLLRQYKELTGCSVLVNTSFNIRGEPIVCTPGEAYRCFASTDMDVLVLGDYVLSKEDQQVESLAAQDDYLQSFKPD